MGRHLTTVFLMLWVAGCVGELELVEGPGGSGGDTTPPASGTPEEAFIDNVQPALTARTCTACHASPSCTTTGDGHCFLGTTAPGDDYTTLSASTYIGTTAAASLLLSVGDHVTGNPSGLAGGPAFCTGPGVPDAGCTTNQVALIEDWILLEAGGI
jgi:hypothetical protein